MIRILWFLLMTLPSLSEALSLEEKAGQVLMVHFRGETANHEARGLIQEVGVGGFIYYNWSNGLDLREQIKNLSRGLQELSSLPLLIAVDQEGGRVCRLKNEFIDFPGNQALAEKSPEYAEEISFLMGQEMLSVGINMNLAPVVDINSNPHNPVIGPRSFGNTPETVIIYGERVLAGFKRAGIITTLKHYPGHGDVEIDSHLDLPVINKSLEELEKMELLPFKKLEADAVMTAHLLVPAFDKENCSTLSKKTLEYLHFKGVIITDSLVMEGVLKKCGSVDEAAIQALNAGCDILLLGGKQLMEGQTSLELSADDIKRIHKSIVNAVKSGRILESRLDDAVKKILKLKEKL